MSEKNKLAPLVDLLELRQAIMTHCTAIRAVVLLMEQGKSEAAMARLDGSLSALQETLRAQCVTLEAPCPHCGSAEGISSWVDTRTCDACGGALDA